MTHGNPSRRKRKDHTTHDMVFHLVAKGHMPGVGERLMRLSPKSQQVVTAELIGRGRRKPSFVRGKEKADKKEGRPSVGQISGKGATILGEDRTMAFSRRREGGTPTRPRTMH